MIGLTYITNQPDRAVAAVASGVDRIMVDLEVLGKAARQAGRDTRVSAHTLEDLAAVRASVPAAEVMVRVDPLHGGSKDQVDACIQRGANRLMLPMFRSAAEVRSFVQLIDGRCSATLLLETSSALARLAGILEIGGFDEVFVGLNDLHVEMQIGFMFELLADGLVQHVCSTALQAGRLAGFGGIGMLGGRSLVPPLLILSEHRRLGSTRTMLSREFDRPTGSDLSTGLCSNAELSRRIETLRIACMEIQMRDASQLAGSAVDLRRIVRAIADRGVADCGRSKT
jgi:hypothetical protein